MTNIIIKDNNKKNQLVVFKQGCRRGLEMNRPRLGNEPTEVRLHYRGYVTGRSSCGNEPTEAGPGRSLNSEFGSVMFGLCLGC